MVHRVSRIQTLRWQTGTVLPDRIRQDTLSAREAEYFARYCEILEDYNREIDMDLTVDLEVSK
jgi:hypothetical protein